MIDGFDLLIYNNIFEIIIYIPFILNIILFSLFPDDKKEKIVPSDSNTPKYYNNKKIILLINIAIILIYLLIKQREQLLSLIFIIIPIFLFIISIIKTYQNKNNYSEENRTQIVYSTLVYLLFFSSEITLVYIETFNHLEHIYKEILLIIFLSTKIILFAYFTITNFIILICNINEIILYKKNKHLYTYFKTRKKEYKLIDYNFTIHQRLQNKISFLIDNILYFILCTPLIILNILKFLIIFFLKKLSKYIHSFLIIIENKSKWNTIIKKVTNISIITSIIIIYIMMTINKTNFSTKIIDIYTFVSTVILIPIIYDSIKTK